MRCKHLETYICQRIGNVQKSTWQLLKIAFFVRFTIFMVGVQTAYHVMQLRCCQEAFLFLLKIKLPETKFYKWFKFTSATKKELIITVVHQISAEYFNSTLECIEECSTTWSVEEKKLQFLLIFFLSLSKYHAHLVSWATATLALLSIKSIWNSFSHSSFTVACRSLQWFNSNSISRPKRKWEIINANLEFTNLVAYTSHLFSSMSPCGSINLQPLSSTGLWLAVIMQPMNLLFLNTDRIHASMPIRYMIQSSSVDLWWKTKEFYFYSPGSH